ncbi:MAG: hypothetical protein JW745_06820 [Sedimentisphaerales bacterium]|nr:hypothetical protein [Sedimentisphaerales bacterium]MBN2842671.1 hypothetical protein [Sedimentisphaerales bacterium]
MIAKPKKERGIMHRARGLSVSVCLLVVFLQMVGCQTAGPVVLPPVLSLGEVLGSYNAQVNSVVPFYASLGGWSGELGTGKDKSKHSDSGGKMFYVPSLSDGGLPRLYMQFDSPLKSKLLVVVSDETIYGLYSETDDGGGSWGYHVNIGKECSDAMPVDIHTLLESLSLESIAIDKVQSFKVTDNYNIVEYTVPTDEVLYLHEISFDRFNSVPRIIRIYARSGRLVAESHLDKYRSLGDALLPGEIVINYYDREARLAVKLNKFKPDTVDRALLFRVAAEKARQYDQLDADCE